MKRILIVDDDSIELLLVRAQVESIFGGWETDTSLFFDDALTKISRERYNLIILDGQLDGANHGYQLIPLIKQKMPRAFILSVSSSEGLIGKGLRLGAHQGCLKKYGTEKLLPGELLWKIKEKIESD